MDLRQRNVPELSQSRLPGGTSYATSSSRDIACSGSAQRSVGLPIMVQCVDMRQRVVLGLPQRPLLRAIVYCTTYIATTSYGIASSARRAVTLRKLVQRLYVRQRVVLGLRGRHGIE